MDLSESVGLSPDTFLPETMLTLPLLLREHIFCLQTTPNTSIAGTKLREDVHRVQGDNRAGPYKSQGLGNIHFSRGGALSVFLHILHGNFTPYYDI